MSGPPELAAAGPRVHVRTVRAEDVEPYRAAVFASVERMRRWNPVTPDDLPRHIAVQSTDYRTFFVIANEPEDDQPMVGRVNLTNAVRGRFRSVAMGYDSYDPYAGRGLFGEGLRLVVDLALADADAGGMDLHRVEANVQPGNQTSSGLLRSLGFRHEGHSRRYLFLPDDEGVEGWRDHERYAITREEWPSAPYAAGRPRRVVVRLTGTGDPSDLDLARGLAVELAVPLLPGDLPGLAGIVRDSPAGAVVLDPPGRAAGDEPSGATELAVVEPAVVELAVAELARRHGRGPASPWSGREVTRVALEVRAQAHSAGDA